MIRNKHKRENNDDDDDRRCKISLNHFLDQTRDLELPKDHWQLYDTEAVQSKMGKELHVYFCICNICVCSTSLRKSVLQLLVYEWKWKGSWLFAGSAVCTAEKFPHSVLMRNLSLVAPCIGYNLLQPFWKLKADLYNSDLRSSFTSWS